jgi:hypothetical protein
VKLLRRNGLGFGLALALGSTSVAHAAAPDTGACIAAFDHGQRLKTDRKLRRAQTELLVCTQETCPSVLRADCAGVLRNVQAALPTIVLAADDGEGHDITDVKVLVGSEVVAQKIDGRAIEFDPGTYDFRFERADAAPITVHHVLREGEKNRAVRASFAKKPTSLSTTTRPMPDVTERDVIGYAIPASLAGLGVIALGVAGFSRLKFDSDVDGMRSRCAPECTQSERSDLSSTLVMSNVSLGIGIGALALAVGSWFFLAPPPATRTAAARGGWAW